MPWPGAAKHCGILATATGQNGPDLPHALALPMSRSQRESTQGLQTAAHPGYSSSARPAPAAGDFSVARDPQVQTARRTRPSPSGLPEQSPHRRPGARGSPSCSTGQGARDQPLTALSRAARSGDADTKGTRASPTWSRAVRAPARPLCARLRWPRPVPARGCRCPVSLPRAARPAAQRPLCLPALRPENCARGRRGASAH